MKITKEMVQFVLLLLFAMILYSMYWAFFTTNVQAIDGIQTDNPIMVYEGFISFSKIKNKLKSLGQSALNVGKKVIQNEVNIVKKIAKKTGLESLAKKVGLDTAAKKTWNATKEVGRGLREMAQSILEPNKLELKMKKPISVRSFQVEEDEKKAEAEIS